MSMKKLLVFGLTSFAVIGMVSLANAADLAVVPAYKAPSPVAAPAATGPAFTSAVTSVPDGETRP